MGFRNGAYLTLWEINDKGNYADCRCSASKKNKQTNQYETDWSGFCRFIGKAHDVVIALSGEHPRVKIGECEVSNNYSKEKNITYTNYAVFTCEAADEPQQTQAQPQSKENYEDFLNIPDGIDEQLPFE